MCFGGGGVDIGIRGIPVCARHDTQAPDNDARGLILVQNDRVSPVIIYLGHSTI